MSGNTPDEALSFSDLKLSAPLLKAIQDVGYETPSPIQAEAIPPLLAGRDLMGQAQTGTGKTGAFALPILDRIDLKAKHPQVLVLAPTRELAIQVAEAFQSYARYLKDFHVLPIYGGQDYPSQLRQLKRGPQVIVGTPGRVMDHMRRGSLSLEKISAVVLDEADEMLRMGFIEDVEWILEQTPAQRQVALFSATVPPDVRRIAHNHLREPAEITIRQATATAATINQRYCLLDHRQKLDALTRILEAEEAEGIIIFVRTKTTTVELAEKLQARGHLATAINGDMAQNLRERTVSQFKSGKLDILIATDVAARGLDVERVSHVINYDIPYDTESYIHRIGRTGRAGRSGEAILFVTYRERRLLGAIEKASRQPMQQMTLPTAETIHNRRVTLFKQQLRQVLASEDLSAQLALIDECRRELEVPAEQIGAALAQMLQGSRPMLMPSSQGASSEDMTPPSPPRARREAPTMPPEGKERRGKKKERDKAEVRDETKRPRLRKVADIPMETFRVEVGHKHGVKPSNIVGAIANEAELDSEYIGHIKIFEDHSLVDLPEGMPRETFQILQKTWVAGQMLRISRLKKLKQRD